MGGAADVRERELQAECRGASREQGRLLSLSCRPPQVYLVRHAGDGRNYVLKVIKLRGIPAKEREARARSARFLAGL